MSEIAVKRKSSALFEETIPQKRRKLEDVLFEDIIENNDVC